MLLELGILAGLYIGIFLEGEFVLLSAVIAAHHGHLDLWTVIIIGFVASVSMDMTFYAIGRSKGAQWISSRRSLHDKISRAESILENNRTLIQWTYRFLPVLRTLIPVLFGMEGIPPSRFFVQSIAGSAVWAGVVVTVGLMVGETIILMLGHLEDIELYIIGGLVATAGILGYRKYRLHRPIAV